MRIRSVRRFRVRRRFDNQPSRAGICHKCHLRTAAQRQICRHTGHRKGSRHDTGQRHRHCAVIIGGTAGFAAKLRSAVDGKDHRLALQRVVARIRQRRRHRPGGRAVRRCSFPGVSSHGHLCRVDIRREPHLRTDRSSTPQTGAHRKGSRHRTGQRHLQLTVTVSTGAQSGCVIAEQRTICRDTQRHVMDAGQRVTPRIFNF